MIILFLKLFAQMRCGLKLEYFIHIFVVFAVQGNKVPSVVTMWVSRVFLSLALVMLRLMVIVANDLCVEGMWIGTTWIPSPRCPRNTIPLTYTRLEAAQCLHNKTVIFGGNSVTRHLYRLLQLFLEGKQEDESQAARLEEKKEQKLEEEMAVRLRNASWFASSSKGNDPIPSREQQCESKQKSYGKFLSFCILYNSNAAAFTTEHWSVNVTMNSTTTSIRTSDPLVDPQRNPFHQNNHFHPHNHNLRGGEQSSSIASPSFSAALSLETTMTTFQGKILFEWVYDWYTPLIVEALKQPNTIVTTNAGLNYLWAHGSHWERTAPLDAVNQQFPQLWNSSIHPTSQLIYRHSTSSCTYGGELLKIQNRINEIVTNEHPEGKVVSGGSRYILPLLPLTADGLHYIDCNHHPGAVSLQTIQFLLNMICSSSYSTVSSSSFNQRLGNRIYPNDLLHLFDNSLIFIVKTKAYYWLISRHKVPLNTLPTLLNKLKTSLKLTVYKASSSFETFVPDLSESELSTKLMNLNIQL